jgi:formylglycine-generating enzyme required for sulfatase activity
VTVRQFQQFLQARSGVRHFLSPKYNSDPDGPVGGVTWHEAAQYCRWLSEQDGPSRRRITATPASRRSSGARTA